MNHVRSVSPLTDLAFSFVFVFVYSILDRSLGLSSFSFSRGSTNRRSEQFLAHLNALRSSACARIDLRGDSCRPAVHRSHSIEHVLIL